MIESCVICLTIKNCAQFLPSVFKNIKTFREVVKDFGVIITFDSCNDNSPMLIKRFKKHIELEKNESKKFPVIIQNNGRAAVPSNKRTINIARGRNECLKLLGIHFPDTKFHMMIDADDVNVKPWKIDVLEKWFAKDDWDCLTFNRPHYYDIWALLYDEYVHHCFGFVDATNMKTEKIITHMRTTFQTKLNKLRDDDLLVCHSAFNGVGLYRTAKFKNIEYKGTINSVAPFFSWEQKLANMMALRKGMKNNFIVIHNTTGTACCEHNYYHLTATHKYGAKIRVTKDYLHDFFRFRF